MKLNKSVIIPILFFAFAALGLEALVLPYVPFGSGRWSDSVGTNVSNRSSRINGNLNVTGNYYKNGVLFTGGGGADVNYDTIYSVKKDSAKFSALLDRGNNWVYLQTFSDVDVGGTMTIYGTAYHTYAATFASGFILADATKKVVNSGTNILYQVTTGGAHIFETQSGTDLLKVDSINGTVVSGYVQLGSSAPFEAVKLIRFKVGQPNTTTTSSHGLDHNSIIGWTCTIRDDTTNTQVNPGAWYSPWVFYAKIDSLNVSITVPASPTGNSIANDTALFRIVYRK